MAPAYSVRLPSPLLGLGKSRVPQVSRTASGDPGLEAQVTAQANCKVWSEERRVSDTLPRTEISLERFKKWDYLTIRHLRTLECPACIEFSLFD